MPSTETLAPRMRRLLTAASAVIVRILPDDVIQSFAPRTPVTVSLNSGGEGRGLGGGAGEIRKGCTAARIRSR